MLINKETRLIVPLISGRMRVRLLFGVPDRGAFYRRHGPNAQILAPRVIDFAPEIRKAIYTTNAIESLNASLRKVTKTRHMFPTD